MSKGTELTVWDFIVKKLFQKMIGMKTCVRKETFRYLSTVYTTFYSYYYDNIHHILSYYDDNNYDQTTQR